MGKVKSKTNALDWCGNLYQFPMGKVKEDISPMELLHIMI